MLLPHRVGARVAACAAIHVEHEKLVLAGKDVAACAGPAYSGEESADNCWACSVGGQGNPPFENTNLGSWDRAWVLWRALAMWAQGLPSPPASS